MVNDSSMPPTANSEPVTRSEFRTAMNDVRLLIDQRFEETKRHAGILHEDLLHKFDLVFEYLTPLGDRVARHEARIGVVETEIDVIKAHLRARR
jgi:hypothetical protein